MNNQKSRPPWRRISLLLITAVAIILLLLRACGTENGPVLTLEDPEIPLAEWPAGSSSLVNLPPQNKGGGAPGTGENSAHKSTGTEGGLPPAGENLSSVPRPEIYELVTATGRAENTTGAELSLPVLVTAFPPEGLNCRAIEVVVPIPKNWGVQAVEASQSITGADISWHFKNGVLRFAYVCYNELPLRFARTTGNETLAIIRLQRLAPATESAAQTVECERLLARGGEGTTIFYETGRPLGEIYFSPASP